MRLRRSRSLYPQGIHDSRLLAIVGALLCIDLFFLTAWQIFDPIRVRLIDEVSYRSSVGHPSFPVHRSSHEYCLEQSRRGNLSLSRRMSKLKNESLASPVDLVQRCPDSKCVFNVRIDATSIFLVLWFFSFVENASCDCTCLEWLAIHWSECLHHLHLLYIGLVGDLRSLRTDSTLLLSQFVLYSGLYYQYRRVSLCPQGERIPWNEMWMREHERFRSSKSIMIRIRDNGNREWLVDSKSIVLAQDWLLRNISPAHWPTTNICISSSPW